ncbi:MAG: response regulator transcription factor [Thermoleophilia bacterium]
MTIDAARVLVVEDDPAVMRAVRVALTNQGHHVLAAGTGAEAVAMTQGGHPRLMVLDLGLPDFDGIEVIRRVRPEHPTLPIIVLSAYGDDRTKIAALDLGADDYVTKPFGIPELLARVRAGLRRVATLDGDGTTFPPHSRVRIDAAAQRVWAA